MVKIYLNLTPCRVAYNTNILNAAQKLFVSIPRFCYHNSLSIAGNCRMCLVEVEKSPKPIPACGLSVYQSIKVYTYSPIVKKAQEAVIEFLLINHPLDCPICDQGGICDLQDQAIKFGNNLSRFYLKKRGVEDKTMGLLVKSIMTRCIHCTRCVRFAYLATGNLTIGTTLRGVHSQVGAYVKKVFHNELSQSIVELCPVSSLKKGETLRTSKVLQRLQLEALAFKTKGITEQLYSPWSEKVEDILCVLKAHKFIESYTVIKNRKASRFEVHFCNSSPNLQNLSFPRSRTHISYGRLVNNQSKAFMLLDTPSGMLVKRDAVSLIHGGLLVCYMQKSTA